jgi:hypothetical protein
MTLTDEQAVVAFAREWAEWHDVLEQARAAPHSYLAITSQNQLTDVPTRFADAPGEWSTGPNGVIVGLAASEELIVDGTAVGRSHMFGVLSERESRFAQCDDAVIEIAKRGGRDFLRPRHPDNPKRVTYRGTPAFPPRRKWVVTGDYHPYDMPRPTSLGAVVDGLEHVYDAAGEVRFTVVGHDLTLTAFAAPDDELMILFTDATSGVTTHAANRMLSTTVTHGRKAVLDFNRAINLPCAYTPNSTCPLPPPENRLPIAIRAGEKVPLTE